MNGNTYTNSQDPCIPAAMTIKQPVEDPEDDLEEIRAELAKNRPLLELIELSMEYAETYTLEELQRIRKEADSEVGPFSPKVTQLIVAFWTATISYSMELATKKSSRQDPCKESEPAAVSDRIAPRQDDSISYGQ